MGEIDRAFLIGITAFGCETACNAPQEVRVRADTLDLQTITASHGITSSGSKLEHTRSLSCTESGSRMPQHEAGRDTNCTVPILATVPIHYPPRATNQPGRPLNWAIVDAIRAPMIPNVADFMAEISRRLLEESETRRVEQRQCDGDVRARKSNRFKRERVRTETGVKILIAFRYMTPEHRTQATSHSDWTANTQALSCSAALGKATNQTVFRTLFGTYPRGLALLC